MKWLIYQSEHRLALTTTRIAVGSWYTNLVRVLFSRNSYFFPPVTGDSFVFATGSVRMDVSAITFTTMRMTSYATALDFWIFRSLLTLNLTNVVVFDTVVTVTIAAVNTMLAQLAIRGGRVVNNNGISFLGVLGRVATANNVNFDFITSRTLTRFA